MPLEPQRYNYYNTRLSELLQKATVHIRNYCITLNDQETQLISQADRLWELVQRQRLVAGINAAASAKLLVVCHAEWRYIFLIIKSLHEQLDDVEKHVTDFQQEIQAITEELCQQGKLPPARLFHWDAFLSKALNVLQTQAKYLKLNELLLQPIQLQSSTVKQFKQDLRLPIDYEASFCMDLARAEQKPPFLVVSTAKCN